MARYVTVSVDGYSKQIMDGPFELDDPSQYQAEVGQRLMLEDAALAAGYHYAADGAFAPSPEPTGKGHKGGKGHKTKAGE